MMGGSLRRDRLLLRLVLGVLRVTQGGGDPGAAEGVQVAGLVADALNLERVELEAEFVEVIGIFSVFFMNIVQMGATYCFPWIRLL